jgi:hypothetical protein
VQLNKPERLPLNWESHLNDIWGIAQNHQVSGGTVSRVHI